jgi:hypothetical protein
MFGSKKRKAEKEAARQAFVTESTQALAEFDRREREIAAMTDQGVKVFALEQLAVDIQKKVKQEEAKIADNGTTLGNTVGISSVVLGGIGVLGGIATAIAVAPVFLLALPAGVALALGGVTGAIKIDEHAADKAKRDGTYDGAFIKKLNHMILKCVNEKDRIIKVEYNALSSSTVFDSIMEKYPNVKEAFVAHARKKDAEEKAAQKKAAHEALMAEKEAAKQAVIEEARRSGRGFTL